MKKKTFFASVLQKDIHSQGSTAIVLVLEIKNSFGLNCSHFYEETRWHRHFPLPSWRKCLGSLTSVLMTW